MQAITVTMLVVCGVVMLMSLWQHTEAAPSWRPQGRFGKRSESSTFVSGDSKKTYWRPQGRYGKRANPEFDIDDEESVKMPALSGEIEFPVEAMSTRNRADAVRVVAKLCTLTGVTGFVPCSGASENSSETF